VILPGTAFVEMALRAGQEVGCELLEELTLQAPLLLPESRGVALQVSVSAPNETGERELKIYSRTEAEGRLGEWILHAEGVLSESAPDSASPVAEWPPEGAEPLDLDSVYARLGDAGFEYGPAFQGLAVAWRLGEDVYAEVSLGPEQAQEAARFAAHPALLDSALHGGIDLIMGAGGRGGGPLLPFAWQGVHVGGPGASALRVKLALGEDSFSLEAFDSAGASVLAVGSVVGREVDPDALRRSSASESLYTPRWEEIPETSSAEDEESTPTRLLRPADLDFTQSEDPAENAFAATASALALIQQRLAETEDERERLVLLTEHALSTGEGEESDLGAASLWGLWRSAASEHPGRFAAIDTDRDGASEEALESALALSSTEPQIAIRQGKVLAPRLTPSAGDGEQADPIDPDTTVLITGGLSGIGAQVARHLAGQGTPNLLLVSRRGMDSEGAAELMAELEALGATVRVEACDVSQRPELEALFESIDPEHPLGVIVHSAGLLDDGLIEALDQERLARVFTPKATAAWHLHELSKDLELSQFLLFSSSAGLLGGAAQANYAAANAFLDALAQRRQAEGLPATSIAWGLWQQGSGALSVEADEAERRRMIEQIRARLGLAPLSAEQGLALFDAARSQVEPLIAAARFDRAALRARAAQGALPALLGGLVRVPARRKDAGESLAKRLASTPEAQREALVLELVRSHTAAVLGHSSAAQVPPERAFKELGFDSLAAVELRNRLGAATGIRLAATVVFDYPSAKDLAGYLLIAAGGKVAEPVAEEAGPSLEEGEAVARIDEMDIEDLVEQTLEGRPVAAESEGAE
jgi:NAD(P)-dependent dehydrogenase (short-subunit alcohol dehydrogenase family)/acyl carrier protein